MHDHTNSLASALSCMLESLTFDISKGAKLGEQTLLDIESGKQALKEYDKENH